jgi:hypothetical protein
MNPFLCRKIKQNKCEHHREEKGGCLPEYKKEWKNAEALGGNGAMHRIFKYDLLLLHISVS